MCFRLLVIALLESSCHEPSALLLRAQAILAGQMLLKTSFSRRFCLAPRDHGSLARQLVAGFTTKAAVLDPCALTTAAQFAGPLLLLKQV